LKAGIFDSGVGGLSVLDSILEHNLFEEIIYYGDTARVPYGTKNPQTIIKYALEALEFFEQFDIDVLIFACNSVSAYAIEILQEKTKLKIFGVIKAGVLATSLVTNKNDNILIIGTKATINSNKYQNNLIKLGYNNITSIPTPLFVPLIEEGILKGEILHLAMKHYFENINKPDIVILGCTHYPFISNEINTFFNTQLFLKNTKG
jgi:glutamate racemase